MVNLSRRCNENHSQGPAALDVLHHQYTAAKYPAAYGSGLVPETKRSVMLTATHHLVEFCEHHLASQPVVREPIYSHSYWNTHTHTHTHTLHTCSYYTVLPHNMCNLYNHPYKIILYISRIDVVREDITQLVTSKLTFHVHLATPSPCQ